MTSSLHQIALFIKIASFRRLIFDLLFVHHASVVRLTEGTLCFNCKRFAIIRKLRPKWGTYVFRHRFYFCSVALGVSVLSRKSDGPASIRYLGTVNFPTHTCSSAVGEWIHPKAKSTFVSSHGRELQYDQGRQRTDIVQRGRSQAEVAASG